MIMRPLCRDEIVEQRATSAVAQRATGFRYFNGGRGSATVV